MSVSEVKKCPECSREMEKGYIISEAIRWSNEKHELWACGQEFVVPWQFWTLPNVKAYRCTNCRLVLFNYGVVMPSETPRYFLKKCAKCGEEIPIASEECQYCGAKQKE
jgi:hypothetical protein